METYWTRRRRLRNEVEIKAGKKCPICNSTKTHENEKGFVCNACGYLNKK